MRNGTRQTLFLIFLLSSLLINTAFAANSSPKEIRFGIFPFLAKPTLEALFAPLAAEISNSLGKPVHFQSASSFETFTSNLMEQQYDIAHIHPFEYVTTASKLGYIPVATRTEMLPAVFAVRHESPVKGPRDLKGKIIGMPPKVSTVSYLAKVALAKEGLKPGSDVTVKYFNTHQNCLQQVLIGSVDACACGRPVLRLFEKESNHSFRTVLTSPEISQTLFVVHKRVPAAERETIRKVIINSQLDNVDPKLRDTFFHKDQGLDAYFRTASDSDYDTVRTFLKMIE